MANNGVFKTLDPNRIISEKKVLNESIPVTGTIVKGTYGTFPSETNIKNFTHEMFQAVYDYPYLSSSANHLLDLTAAQSSDTTGVAATTGLADKNNIYRSLSQQYVGYDTNQSPVPWNSSGVLNPDNTWDPDKITNVVVMDFSRVLVKDEIKKGSFQLTLGTGSFAAPFVGTKTLSDAYVSEGNLSSYKTNSPMGEYAFLQLGTGTSPVPTKSDYGFIYYQAGTVVLINSTLTFGTELTSGSAFTITTAQTPEQAAVSSSIKDIVNGVRAHVQNIQFNNTTELNSTSYFVNLAPNEFNYSNNPSFVSGSEIVVKNGLARNPSTTYLTTVGLYSADNQLLAVGKLSEPLKKTPANEISLKMRIDY
tara:strand:- start:10864 stop:11955 length:1092 start_codon:yes stop_codon:yes gene_type:complete